jgi:hypothetical protein
MNKGGTKSEEEQGGLNREAAFGDDQRMPSIAKSYFLD